MLTEICALHIGTIHSTGNMDISDACSISSLESDYDLSLAFEREREEPADFDELPAFEIRAYAPKGRTPSPIDDLNMSDMGSAQQLPSCQRSPEHQNNPEFVALHEIHAQISATNDIMSERMGDIGHANNLETIFEGVFLHTPPRDSFNKSAGAGLTSKTETVFTPKRSRTNLMELLALNRIHSGGKENWSPRNMEQDEHT